MSTDRSPTLPALLTTQQAAERLGLTTTSLHDLQCKDDGLPIVQKGLLVGYQLEDIQAFEQRELFAIVKQVLAADHRLTITGTLAQPTVMPVLQALQWRLQVAYFLVPYGDWFVGFNDTPTWDACDCTASSVRPIFRPMTRVGVFALASCWSCLSSLGVQHLR